LAKHTGRYIRRIRRRNAIKVTAVIIVFLAGMSIVYFNREKTMLLEPETFLVSENTKALFIKNEAIIYLGHDIVKNQKEGSKISKNSVLAKGVNTEAYADYEKEIIENKLRNYMYDDKSLFLNDLKKSAKEENASRMFATLKYLYYSKEQLDLLYKRYNNIVKSSELKLSDLPIDFAGQVYYSTDGYEDIAPMSLLSILSPEYIDFVYNIDEKVITKRDSMVVKIIDNSCIFASFILPLSKKVDYENTVMNYKSNILNLYDVDYSNYFLFLKERMDLLNGFPEMYFEINDKTIAGHFIDVREFKDKKIITLCVVSNAEEVLNLRTTDISVHTERYENVFVVPAKSVYKNQNKQDCIDIIDRKKIKKTYAVNIRGYDKENNNILIDTKGVLISSEDENEQKRSENMSDYTLLIK